MGEYDRSSHMYMHMKSYGMEVTDVFAWQALSDLPSSPVDKGKKVGTASFTMPGVRTEHREAAKGGRQGQQCAAQLTSENSAVLFRFQQLHRRRQLPTTLSLEDNNLRSDSFDLFSSQCSVRIAFGAPVCHSAKTMI
jgi:hypothetical protein